MQQLIAPNQTVLGFFPDLPAAEAALQSLQLAGFSADCFVILPTTLRPNPPVDATEAKRGAAGGAIAGTFLGLMIGLVLGYMATISSQVGAVHPTEVLIGLALLGSGVGAAGASLMGGLSGFNVSKAAAEPETIAPDERYVLVAEEISADAIAEIKTILAQLSRESA